MISIAIAILGMSVSGTPDELLWRDAVAQRVGLVVVRKLEIHRGSCSGKSGVALEECVAGGRRRLDDAVRVVLLDRSPEGDAALVRLLGYYLGEDYGEEIEHEITARGRRCRALLEAFGKAPMPCAFAGDLRGICLPPNTVHESRKRCLDAIEKGVVLFKD